MKIVYVFADNPAEWNCSEWRCAIPARAFNRSGRHSAEMVSIGDFASHSTAAEEACREADVIVVQRNLFGPVLSAIQHWKAQDKTIVADFDDAYNLIHPSNASYSFWAHGVTGPDESDVKVEPPPLTQFKWGLRMVHAATVPSMRLADDWRTYTDVYHVPNYVELDKYQNIRREAHDGIIIGWGGSVSHLQSFTDSGIFTALQNVCRQRPQVKVMVCGSDRRIFEQLPLPPEQKILQPWVPYSEWSSVLAQFDIGLAPLQGPYDERRSWIKVMEYMLMKIPWIASDGPAYHSLRPYGWLVRNTTNAWERMLLDMVDHLADYKAEAMVNPYIYAISQNIDDNLEKVLAIYSQIAAWANLEPGQPMSAQGGRV